MNCKKLITLLLLAYAAYSSAQNAVTTDTVELARKLSYGKHYPEAIVLLKKFELNHPADINSVRLHGQVLYWQKDFDTALLLFHDALKRNPNRYVQLDYARMLFDLYHLDDAKYLLEDYIKKGPNDIEALNTLGTIAYLQGHTALAKQYFAKVKLQYPNNEWAVKYTGEMEEAQKLYITLKGAYTSDSQPLNAVTADIETGWYQSYLLAPDFDVKTTNFTTNGNQSQVYQFYGANKFYFYSAGLKVNVGAGVYQNTGDSQTGWLSSVTLNEKISNQLSVEIFGAHQNYLSTISSLTQPVTLYNYGTDVIIGQAGAWSGWAGYSQQRYIDNNTNHSAGAYVLSPPVKADDVTFHFGYAFAYNNADVDNYVPSNTIAQVLATNSYNGVYVPYFTSKNQVENSVLANINYQPTEDISASVNTKIGLYTTADKPYFYLNYSAANQLIIQKGFYSQRFTPVQINAAIKYQLTNKAYLQAGYAYIDTFFYHSNIVTLTLNHKF